MTASPTTLSRIKTASLLSVIAAAALSIVATSSLSTDGPPSSAGADPQQALGELSQGAEQLPPTAPESSQFLYKKIRFAGGDTGQFWISIDGAHDGAMVRPDLDATIPLPGCVDGVQRMVENWVEQDATAPCSPVLTYDPSLPSDAAGFRAWLDRQLSPELTAATEVRAHIQAKITISLLTFTLLTPQQRAAVFEAAGGLPGILVDQDAVDAIGRQGTKISWEVPGPAGLDPYAGSIIIDPTTYELLGSSDGLTVLTTSVVDAVGETGE